MHAWQSTADERALTLPERHSFHALAPRLLAACRALFGLVFEIPPQLRLAADELREVVGAPPFQTPHTPSAVGEGRGVSD